IHYFSYSQYSDPLDLHSFPTRRSSDLGVRLAKPQVIAAYPITPQTTLVEKLADFIADGQSQAKYMMVESEHSAMAAALGASMMRSEEHTSELQSRFDLVCRLLLEKKKN